MTDQSFPNQFFGLDDPSKGEHLGIVVGGSLSGGLEVKLDRQTMVEGLAVGSYVTIAGDTGRRFFGLITDVVLSAVDDSLRRNPPDLGNDTLRKIYAGTAVYATMRVTPQLMLERGVLEARPVKTVPAHFSAVARATPDEVLTLFNARGTEGEGKPYHIGSSLEDEKVKINIDLTKLVERSTAVFGRSGTGKTFLTLPLLAGIIHHKVASCLIFDMHNDYGHTLKGDRNKKLPGLKRLNAISDRVIVVTLDEQSSLMRKSAFEFALRIGYDQIEPEDLEMLKKVVNLSDAQIATLFLLKRRFPEDWITRLLNEDGDDGIMALIDEGKLVDGTVAAIQRKLARMLKFSFLAPSVADDDIRKIVTMLSEGRNVVIEFGRYGNDLPAYVFVANFLTRRIHNKYVEMKDAAEGGGGAEPNKLVIAIEEAHKFLEPGVAEFTIFGTIARELRKYNVTLLIVDQRPSQIDAEVMSQIGTRITCALSDEKDIAAVFTGVNGAQTLRNVLSSLDSKQQALLMGHALPMPVVVRTVAYDSAKVEEFSVRELDTAERKEHNQRKLGRSNPDDSLID